MSGADDDFCPAESARLRSSVSRWLWSLSRAAPTFSSCSFVSLIRTLCVTLPAKYRSVAELLLSYRSVLLLVGEILSFFVVLPSLSSYPWSEQSKLAKQSVLTGEAPKLTIAGCPAPAAFLSSSSVVESSSRRKFSVASWGVCCDTPPE